MVANFFSAINWYISKTERKKKEKQGRSYNYTLAAKEGYVSTPAALIWLSGVTKLFFCIFSPTIMHTLRGSIIDTTLRILINEWIRHFFLLKHPKPAALRDIKLVSQSFELYHCFQGGAKSIYPWHVKPLSLYLIFSMPV